MRKFLEKIRMPEHGDSLKKQVLITCVIMLAGAVIGVLQKWMDGTPDNMFPTWMQELGIVTYFGRLAVWVLLATIISVYSKTPLRASVNTFVFLLSMVAGYYIYCNFVLGFLPVSYMMIWIIIAFASFFAAYVCWYAKGHGIVAIIISSGIIGVLLAQAFSFTHGLYVFDYMEIITWIAGVIVLYRKSKKEFVIELLLSVVVAVIYQLFIPYWG